MGIQRGFYQKYYVAKLEGEGQVEACLTDVFVLRPSRDPAALRALQKYVHCTRNRVLARDLQDWIDAIKANQSGE